MKLLRTAGPAVAWPRRRERLTLIALCALYGGAYLLLVGVYPPAVNPDATAYLRLAQHYVNGDIAEAVVSHWAPLYAWLIAPLLAVGIGPVTAATLLQGVIGLGGLVMCWLLLGRLGARNSVRLLTCAALVPLLVRYSYSPLGPDLLVATLYLGLVLLLLDPRWSRDCARLPVAAGGLVGLAYLTKGTVALGLTLIPVICGYVLRWRGSGPIGPHARGLALVLLVACALVVPWAIAISLDENTPTLGTSAAYSWAVVGPLRQGVHPMTSDGFLTPPHPEAVSAWEDPARLEVEPWGPLEDPWYALGRFASNGARYGVRALESVPVAGLLALAALFAIRRERRHPAWVLAAFGLLVPLAYSPVLMQERYAWGAYLLVVVLAGVGVLAFVRSRSIGGRPATILLLTMVLSNTALAARQLTIDGVHRGSGERRVAAALRELDVTRVAANREWTSSLPPAFRSGDQFFGVPRPRQSDASIGEDLDRLGIDGFLLWDEPARPPGYLRGFTRGPAASIEGMPVTLFSRLEP